MIVVVEQSRVWGASVTLLAHTIYMYAFRCWDDVFHPYGAVIMTYDRCPPYLWNVTVAVNARGGV